MSPATARRARRQPTAAATVLLLLLAAALPVRALDDNSQQPLYLESDSAELDEVTSVSVYTGNVVVKQGSMEIEADQVTVYHHPDRRPKRIVAQGNPAKYRQQVEAGKKNVEAEALRMEYETDANEITLVDKALLYQGEDTFRSDRIVYDRANARVKAGTSANGKERVKIFITNPGQR